MLGKKTKDKPLKQGYNRNAEGEKTAAHLPDLELEAKNLANFMRGYKRTSKKGDSPEFRQHTPFISGDHTSREIDWKASGRREDRYGNPALLVREREMEMPNTFYLWRDPTTSMDYKSRDELHTKREVADILVMALAYLSADSDEAFTLLGSDLKLNTNKRMAHGIGEALEQQREQGDALPKLPIHRGRRLPPNSHVALISDFLMPPEDIAETIKSFNQSGVKGHLIQVLDPREFEFNLRGRVILNDKDSGARKTFGKAESVKDDIREAVRAHQDKIKKITKHARNWKFSYHITDEPHYHALLPLFGMKKPPRTAPAHRPS